MGRTSAILALVGAVGLNSVYAQDYPGSGRLKFKQGPVCMCDKGLSEDDIRKAEEERMGSSQPGLIKKGIKQNESSQKAKRRRDEAK